jgi:NAD(P)H-flavin reductase
LALLRAIRLRQAAPDAVAAGAADTAAALTGRDELGGCGERAALPPGETHPALPPGPEQAGGGQVRPLRPGWAASAATTDGERRTEPETDAENGRADGDLRASAGSFFNRAGPAATPARTDESGISETGKSPKMGTPDASTDAGPAAPGTTSGSHPAGTTQGPLLRPRGLSIDPLRKSSVEPASPGARHPDPAAPGAGHPDPAIPGAGHPNPATRDAGHPGPATPGAGHPYPATPGAKPEHLSAEPAGRDNDIVPVEQEQVGRLSRNRFAGLPPARKQARDEPSPAETGPARPSWASGEHEVPGMRAPSFVTPPMVAAPGRTSAVDGMDPADDALLRQTKRLLGNSLAIAGGPESVAGRFRAALQQAHPLLLAALPGNAATQTARLTEGLIWLVGHLDQPPLLVGGCARLGAALAECGVPPDQLRMVGAALAEAIRAGTPTGEWGQELDLAWRSTWQHVYEWILHGETLAAEQPVAWTAVVVSHELRRPDLAVVRLRPYLPMPFRPGQYARVEVPEVPGIWRPYSLAGAPRRNDLIELHVRAKTRTGVSGTLVYRTQPGDEVRLSRAEGDMSLPASPDRNLLMIAGDTGVAPLKALLTELADTGDARSAVLFWGVRNLAELYDLEDIAEIARSAKRATVVPVVSEGDPGPYASGLVTDAVAAYGEWSRHEVYLAGPPLMLAATSAALHQLGVAADHIHHDAPE